MALHHYSRPAGKHVDMLRAVDQESYLSKIDTRDVVLYDGSVGAERSMALWVERLMAANPAGTARLLADLAL